MLQSWALTPDRAAAVFKGMTGHSQGIVAAVCAAAAGSWTAFVQRASHAVLLLMWTGVRVQQASPFAPTVRAFAFPLLHSPVAAHRRLQRMRCSGDDTAWA